MSVEIYKTLSLSFRCQEIDKVKGKRTKQTFTGKIINSKDFVVNIHGQLYHESLPNGHKKIDVKISEKKKRKGGEGESFAESNKEVATVSMKLDENNHSLETKVEEIITNGKSTTTYNKGEGEINNSLSGG